jgi:ribonuclease R
MKKQVIKLFEENPGRSFKSKQISKKLNIVDEDEYIQLKTLLHKLYSEEFLIKSGKRYQLNRVPESNIISGILQIFPQGYGFVVSKNKELGDIFIAARNFGPAFHGDYVEVSLFAKQKGKNLEGQIVRVLKRNKAGLVGELQKMKSFYVVKPDDPLIHRDLYIDKDKLSGAKPGDKVLVGNIKWESSKLSPEADVIEILGKTGTLVTEVQSLAREFNLPYKFPESVLDDAEKISEEISPIEINGRKDFRNSVVFTIDPVDAKDFDDALSIEVKDDNNIEIGIHIADVSHFVKPNTSLDKESEKRGNSVYLVGSVIPMLPEKLSNNICSLVPGKDRLTYSVIALLSPKGKLISYEIVKSIINSKRRFNYDEVQKIIETGHGDFNFEINELNKLAQTLRKKRMREGSIEFFSPEVKFELDETGRPVAVHKKEIKESNMLVEEFMLLANRIVATLISLPVKGKIKPFVYRIHDLPEAEKLKEFARFVKTLGYPFNPAAKSKVNQFHLLITKIRGTEEEALINELAIRSMAKAVYSTNNIGHYGLGFDYYTHFTSPIRRYADLLVHRIIFSYLNHSEKINVKKDNLEKICLHISNCERIALEAERTSVKRKQIEYLENHLGEEFHAIISGVLNFGIFVELTDILAEGLVRARDLEGDFYVYDEKKYALIGRRTKKQYRLGDKVTVRLIRVDSEKSELDFIIVEN